MRIKQTLLRCTVAGILALGCVCPQKVCPGVWEFHEQVTQDSDVDPVAIERRGNTVFLTLQRTSTVKVFTLLGQLVSQEVLRPGTHRLALRTKGIYIIRVGSWARRITI